MNFSIERVAKEYIYKRYPNASVLEKEKYVTDWKNKIRDSRSLVADFKNRVDGGSLVGKKILDAGSGNGGISIAFAEAGAEAYGIEIEEELYKIGQEHAASYGVNPKFFLYDGERLPFEDNFFDFAVSASVLEHTSDPVLYLSEILRVLKRGGSLYLGFPNKLAPRETHTQLLFLTYLPAFLRPLYIKLFHCNPLPDNNLHFYGYFDLKRMLKEINGKIKYPGVIVEEKGHSVNLFKKIVKKLLSSLGLSYKIFLPHILVIIRKA